MDVRKLCQPKREAELAGLLAKSEIKADCVVHPRPGDTVLHVCSKLGMVDAVKATLEVDDPGAGGSVVSPAATEGRRRLLVNVPNLDGKKPLHDAAQFARTEVMRVLLGAGADVNAIKRADWTPLMLACTKRNLINIRLLLDAGADPLLKNKDGWTALHLACREGHEDIVEQMLEVAKETCFTASNNGRTPMHTACLHGNLGVVKQLAEVTGRESLEIVDSCGSTPFMDACRSGSLPLIQYLHTELKVDVEARDLAGRSAAHVAAESGQCASLRYLIVHCHVSPDIRSTGQGPGIRTEKRINQVEKSFSSECISEDSGKLEGSADVSDGGGSSTGQGVTPLHLAAKEGHGDVVRMLVEEFHADTRATDPRGRSGYDLALQNRHKCCVDILGKHV